MTDVPRNDRIERLLEEIQRDRRVRLDILRMDDMVPRNFKRRARPKTAVIARAAQVAIEVSEWLREAQAPIAESEEINRKVTP
jgi:hypothetical protein